MVIESFFCVSMVDHHKIGRENETYLNHQMGYDTPSLASKSTCYAKNSPHNSTSQMVPTQKRPHYHKVHKVHKVHKLLQDQAHMGLHNFPIFCFFCIKQSPMKTAKQQISFSVCFSQHGDLIDITISAA